MKKVLLAVSLITITEKMHKRIFMVLSVIILLLLNSCKSNPVIPPEIQPGRRDYVWTIDTLRLVNNNILDIWGSAPDDIWGVGPGSHSLWHYDGKKWTSIHDDNAAIYDINCVYGFSKNDVWIAGGNGRIYHYDGNTWSLNYQHTINDFTGIYICDLYGVGPNDLYAVGVVFFTQETRRGIILHYDGSKWEEKYLADYNSYFIEVKETIDRKCFIHCIKQDVINYGTDTTVIYQFDNNGLHELYNDKDKNPKGARISIIGGEAYFALGTDIYRYRQNGFVEFLKTGSIWTPAFYDGHLLFMAGMKRI